MIKTLKDVKNISDRDVYDSFRVRQNVKRRQRAIKKRQATWSY